MITWFLTTRLGRWLAAIGAVIVAILSTWFVGRMQGEEKQKRKNDQQNAQANAEAVRQVNQAIEDRSHVDSEVEALPVAPAQPVATADPSSAAGELRQWVRKDGGQD